MDGAQTELVWKQGQEWRTKFLHATISKNPDSLDDGQVRAHRNLDLNPHERGLRDEIDASLVPHCGDDGSGELGDLR